MRFGQIAVVGFCFALLAGGVALNWRGFSGDEQKTSHSIDFNRDIRPILNKNCTSCHGGVKQAGEVSFIYREQALGKGKSGRPTVIPGKPNASELIARIVSHDPELRMPLNAPPLEEGQVALLKQWIKEGAQWEDYWAFVAPKPQALPKVENEDWIRQPLDQFILARLEKEGLTPSPEANKAALLRRVSFDLTGLPPTPEELDAFLSDDAPDAYEKQVDRLLASPAYGERWASMWLDLARYADSSGFAVDAERAGAWVYRDWVIDAFNKNLPYSHFMIKQLAGDLLSEASLEDLIASSFNRQTPTSEVASDKEEYRLIAVMDRVATTWNVANGITMNCVQCHDHPYDPINHTDYYKSLAFFNTTRDYDLSSLETVLEYDWPRLRVPKDRAHFLEAANIQHQINELREKIITSNRYKILSDRQWKDLTIDKARLNEALGFGMQLENAKALYAKLPSDADESNRKSRREFISALEKKIAELSPSAIPPATFRLYDGIAEPTGTVPKYSVFDLSAPIVETIVTALRIDASPAEVKKARHTPEYGFIVHNIDAWVQLPDGRTERIPFQHLVLDSEEDLERNMSRLIENSPIHEVDSPATPIQRLAKERGFMANPKHSRERSFVAVPDKPLDLPPGSRIKIRITHRDSISNKPAYIPRIRLRTSNNPGWTSFGKSRALQEEIAQLEQLEYRIRKMDTVPLPIMDELAPDVRRETRKFERGNYLNKTGPVVSPGVPEAFPAMSGNTSRDRLGFAQWLFESDQPLTARVAVNRYWEQLFGLGIVETLEDFGSAGDTPSHPALLDWLALHFQNDLQWDMKALLRELVVSATYRQSAKNTPVLQHKDPRNRLLARGPQQRLTAEMVRDQALRASGLLTVEIGGPPVMPPQPEGIWKKHGFDKEGREWKTANGPDRYRRAVYTFIKRNNKYPSLLAFDASDHQASLARRIPTNTPLQALVTLNDPVYREAAEALAHRMEETFPGNNGIELLGDRLNYGARRVLSRDLTPKESLTLSQLYNDLINEHKNREREALIGSAVALLNLDAAFTR